MLRGIILCGLGLVTTGLGIKHIYDVKKAEAEVQEVSSQEEQESIEIAD